MLHSSEVIFSVLRALKNVKKKKLSDPVMVAKGFKLINDKAIYTLKEKIIPKAYLITPNIPEAEVLLEQKLNQEDMIKGKYSNKLRCKKYLT